MRPGRSPAAALKGRPHDSNLRGKETGVNADVLAWLKGHGRRYQTRINRILRVVMESHPPRAAR